MTHLLLLLACQSPAPAPVTDVSVAVNPDVGTVLSVAWTLTEGADAVAVEYSFEEGRWESTPPEALAAGACAASILGVPADTRVDIRIVGETDGERWVADDGAQGTTGPLPESLPLPSLVAWDPDLASTEPFLLTTVSEGVADYSGTWWVMILDRQARVVWYRMVPEERVTVMSRVSADGTHITWGEVTWFGDASTLERATLDLGWLDSLELPSIGYTYDELPDGTIAYDSWTLGADLGIRTIAPDGAIVDVFSCTEWAQGAYPWGDCGANAVNWSEARGTYLWSMYELDTVIEVDPVSGLATGSWGRSGDDAIEPDGVGLQMQHYPNWTAEGTLLLHTQEPGDARVEWAREFALDEATGAIEQIWSYSATDRYADCSGEAVRLSNGNTLLNYGCGAAIREITTDGTVVWEVETGALVGHQTQIGDLYAVNRGR